MNTKFTAMIKGTRIMTVSGETVEQAKAELKDQLMRPGRESIYIQCVENGEVLEPQEQEKPSFDDINPDVTPKIMADVFVIEFRTPALIPGFVMFNIERDEQGRKWVYDITCRLNGKTTSYPDMLEVSTAKETVQHLVKIVGGWY